MRGTAAIVGPVLCAAALALAGCGGGDSSSEPTAARPPTELEAAVEKAAASGVPVRIPPALLESPPPGANHAEVLRSPPDSYTLGLATRSRCRFKSDCVVAIFSGSTGAGAKIGGRKLQLAAGIEGSYEPGRCGPGCEFGTVAWDQNGDTYGIGVPNAAVSELMVLANEAIEAEPAATAGE